MRKDSLSAGWLEPSWEHRASLSYLHQSEEPRQRGQTYMPVFMWRSLRPGVLASTPVKALSVESAYFPDFCLPCPSAQQEPECRPFCVPTSSSVRSDLFRFYLQWLLTEGPKHTEQETLVAHP